MGSELFQTEGVLWGSRCMREIGVEWTVNSPLPPPTLIYLVNTKLAQ